MNKYNWLIISLSIILIITTIVIIWIRCRQAQEHEMALTDDYATHDVIIFEDQVPPADTLIVGKWRNTENPLWFKVYYDDYDEDMGLYWGKEWDESEDVQEEDLNYHGNGWFRWEKRGQSFREYATMDVRDIPIARHYVLVLSTSDSLIYCERDHADVVFRFSRIK